MYNALTIHGLVVAEQLPGSVLEVSQFWSRTSYLVGGLGYSLDDIEHGVLRGWTVVWNTDYPVWNTYYPVWDTACLYTLDSCIEWCVMALLWACVGRSGYEAGGKRYGVRGMRPGHEACFDNVQITEKPRKLVSVTVRIFFSLWLSQCLCN